MINSLEPIFQHDFEQTVWQVAADAGGQLLAVEIRDMQNAQVSFSLLDLKTMSLLFDRYGLEEDWWLSLAAVRNGRLLIKQYRDSQQPEQQGLVAINVRSLEPAWWLENFALTGLDENTVAGKVVSEKGTEEVLIDLQSGDRVDRAMKAPEVAPEPRYLNPSHYSGDSPHFLSVEKFVANTLNLQAVGACDYLETGEVIIISFFIRERGGLANELAVFSSDGDLLLHRKIAGKLEAIASGTFFVFDNYLVFIANKTQICVYDLSKVF